MLTEMEGGIASEGVDEARATSGIWSPDREIHFCLASDLSNAEFQTVSESELKE